jgi:hypothetical protein
LIEPLREPRLKSSHDQELPAFMQLARAEHLRPEQEREHETRHATSEI